MAGKKIKLAVVFGTRPEAIKLVPVIQKLSGDPQFQVVSIVTAQHREMLDQVLKAFCIRPHYDLGIVTSHRTLAGIVSQCLDGLDGLFKRIKPGAVLVQASMAERCASQLTNYEAPASNPGWSNFLKSFKFL